MLKKMILLLGFLISACSLIGADIQTNGKIVEGECPDGYISITTLGSIQPGENSSKIIEQECRPVEDSVKREILQPMSPEEFEAARPPDEWADQGETVNGIVTGITDDVEYRCVVLLEPIQSGEQFSKASEPFCSKGLINIVDGISLKTNYLIAKFYDKTGYKNILIEYYGTQPCSPEISYGIGDIHDNLDNKFASAQVFSDCDHIDIYDFNNHIGASYSCGANCSSFYALSDEVSSWRASD